jgi:glutathione synthase/RimK-type ligase-like ATP-grasp enzyme
LASDKLRTFNQWSLHGVPCPEWTTDIEEAKGWLVDTTNSPTVFCRTLTRAHSGRGIAIARLPEEVVPAPLYTKYIKKKKEFRVHVFNRQVIDVQEKRLSSNAPQGNFLIRNHANGFVFCREDLVEPSSLRSVALAAVSALSLDFGAVDIIYNEKQDQCYALEVNSAPGLEGTTLEKYTNAIKELAYG